MQIALDVLSKKIKQLSDYARRAAEMEQLTARMSESETSVGTPVTGNDRNDWRDENRARERCDERKKNEAL